MWQLHEIREIKGNQEFMFNQGIPGEKTDFSKNQGEIREVVGLL